MKLQDYVKKYSNAYIVEHTIVPSNSEDVPRIIGWCGPARSGSTALLYLLASHPQINRAYFQPQKTLARVGGHDFMLHKGDRTVCMKEVFADEGDGVDISQDPVGFLLQAGVPKDKITWIILLRDPIHVFSSATYHNPVPVTPATIADAQELSIRLYWRYKKAGINVIPFVYDLVRHNEEKAISALLERVGLKVANNIAFNTEAINKKVVLGQAKDEEYFAKHVRPMFERKKYVFSNGDYAVSQDKLKEVKQLCEPQFLEFLELAKVELGI